MRIQEAITKAREGGYPADQLEAPSRLVQAQYFLDTAFWEALGRTLGWEGHCAYRPLRGHEPRTLRQPMWLSYWHRFNSHLVAGNTPESFFAHL